MNDENVIGMNNGKADIAVARKAGLELGTVPMAQFAPWQYWTFFTTCMLLSILLIVQVVFGRMTQFDEQKLSIVQQTIQELSLIHI